MSGTGYIPGAEQLAVIVNLLQKHGSVVLPMTWDMDGIVMKLRDIAPSEVLIRGRKQPYLGEDPGVTHPVIHMNIDLEHEGIVIEEIEPIRGHPYPSGVVINREGYISTVKVPVQRGKLFDLVMLLKLDHIRYVTTGWTPESTTVEFGAPEVDKLFWINTMDAYLSKAAALKATLETSPDVLSDAPVKGDL